MKDIDFPELKRKIRDREYNQYSSIIIEDIVYWYLFKGLSHRALDEKFIGLDPEKSKGYQAMGILHFLGLRNEHKNYLNGTDIKVAISILHKILDSSLIVEHLKNFNKNKKHRFDIKKIENELQKNVYLSKKSTQKERRKKIKSIENNIPEKIEVITVIFKRNPDVIVEVLDRANGFCEYCNKKAPFLRAKDNTPYLEVHHKIPLSDRGMDNIDNAVALCPNCHRQEHYGV